MKDGISETFKSEKIVGGNKRSFVADRDFAPAIRAANEAKSVTRGRHILPNIL
jgi:hypothetical protein